MSPNQDDDVQGGTGRSLDGDLAHATVNFDGDIDEETVEFLDADEESVEQDSLTVASVDSARVSTTSNQSSVGSVNNELPPPRNFVSFITDFTNPTEVSKELCRVIMTLHGVH